MNTLASHDPYQALRYRDFRLLMTGNLVSSMGAQMLALAIGWELYNRTNSALALGIVGLVQVVPVIALALVAGHVADHYNRKRVVIAAQVVMATAALGLAALSYWQGSLVGIYACLLLRGIGSAFSSPAASTLPAEIVPEEVFENAASWRNTIGKFASIVGPALGGLLIAAALGTATVYVLSALAAAIFVILLCFMRADLASGRSAIKRRERPTLHSLGEGIGFLRRTPVILSAITLDLFAVLFGGAVTLMPIFARDILHVGPSGLGWLEAAPSIGAVGVALFLAHRPPMQRAGPIFLLAVTGFGLTTIVFGFSQNFWLSMAMMLIAGGLDCISMIVRGTLMLARVPNEMRGRVAAINGLFISSSNQLGGFESGLTAQIFGPVLSVVGGAVATILVVLAVIAVWPDLRRLRTLRETTEAVVVPPAIARRDAVHMKRDA